MEDNQLQENEFMYFAKRATALRKTIQDYASFLVPTGSQRDLEEYLSTTEGLARNMHKGSSQKKEVENIYKMPHQTKS